MPFSGDELLNRIEAAHNCRKAAHSASPRAARREAEVHTRAASFNDVIGTIDLLSFAMLLRASARRIDGGHTKQIHRPNGLPMHVAYALAPCCTNAISIQGGKRASPTNLCANDSMLNAHGRVDSQLGNPECRSGQSINDRLWGRGLVVFVVRRRIAATALAVLLSVPASGAELPTKAPKSLAYKSADGSYLLFYDQQLRYVSWDGTRGYPRDFRPLNTNAGSGSQFYSPMALQFIAKPARDWSFDILARSGYVESRQTTAGQSGSYSGMIDTVLSAKVAYHHNPNFVPFLSFMANVPTGQTKLLGTSQFARMDPDIVDVATFGEGFNAGVTGGATVAVRPNIWVTVAVGHTNRGSYTRDDPVAVVRSVSPGDETTGVIRVASFWGPLSLRAGLSVATDSTTTVSNSFGTVTVKPGDRIGLNTGASYRWSRSVATHVDIGWSHQQSNSVVRTPAPFSVPAGNANAEILRVSLLQNYYLGRWVVGGRVAYMTRSANEYSSELAEFIPAKQKWEVGALASYQALANLRFDGRIARIWTSEDGTPNQFIGFFPGCCTFAGTAIPQIKQDAWALTFGGVATFP